MVKEFLKLYLPILLHRNTYTNFNKNYFVIFLLPSVAYNEKTMCGRAFDPTPCPSMSYLYRAQSQSGLIHKTVIDSLYVKVFSILVSAPEESSEN